MESFVLSTRDIYTQSASFVDLNVISTHFLAFFKYYKKEKRICNKAQVSLQVVVK